MAATRKPDPRSSKRRSLRLVFEYEDRNVRLVSVQPVEMLAPPPQAAVPRVGEAGSWLELRDSAGQPLYRRVIHNPIPHDMEVVPDDPDEPLQRVPVKRPQGAFHLIVPEISAAHTLALNAEPARRPAGRKAAAAASGVMEFPLARVSTED